jgi:hypothetical protein
VVGCGREENVHVAGRGCLPGRFAVSVAAWAVATTDQQDDDDYQGDDG